MSAEQSPIEKAAAKVVRLAEELGRAHRDVQDHEQRAAHARACIESGERDLKAARAELEKMLGDLMP